MNHDPPKSFSAKGNVNYTHFNTTGAGIGGLGNIAAKLAASPAR